MKKTEFSKQPIMISTLLIFIVSMLGWSIASSQSDSTVFLPIISRDPDRVIHYVSKSGNNANGSSWTTAWNELNQIDWDEVNAGDFIYIDGGSSSMTYETSLRPTKSGFESKPITIQLAPDSGRNGQIIMFGGNAVPLPECGQLSWDESGLQDAEEWGIQLRNEVEHIIIDGKKRAGIVIHGYSQAGVRFFPDTIDNGQDDNPKHVTLRYMEIYNNGEIERVSDGSVADLYFPLHSRPGISLAGSGHTFQYLEVHDNAGDAVQSGFTNPSGGTFNDMDDLTITHSWFYNSRPHSGIDNSPAGEVCTQNDVSGCDELGAPHMARDYQFYPDFPNNRRESFNWCTHSDGIQLYSSNDFNNLTIENTIIGPNFMNGLILGDRGGTNDTAWVNNLTMNDVVITRYMHNALGMNNRDGKSGSNWNIDHVTFYGHYNNLHKGSLQLDLVSNGPGHSLTNSYKIYGQSSFGTDEIEFANNCEYNMYKGSINGIEADPRFRRLSNGDVFESDLNVDFATVFKDNYSVTNPTCESVGSRLTSAEDLLSLFR